MTGVDVPLPTPPTRSELRTHLVRTFIAGRVDTPRQNNLLHYRRMSNREPYYLFGLDLGAWTFEETLALMAKRCGVNPDPGYLMGVDTIDPDRTIDALDAMAARLSTAARRTAAVMLATGHPAGLLPVYLAIARALAARGCALYTPAEGWTYQVETPRGPRARELRYVDGVAVLHGGGSLHHTHDPDPMRAMVATLEAEGRWPELVVADHGWAGAAGQAGIDTVGFADCNDPALFAGEAEGTLAAVVPLDDNVAPHHYAPLTSYLLAQAGLYG